MSDGELLVLVLLVTCKPLRQTLRPSTADQNTALSCHGYHGYLVMVHDCTRRRNRRENTVLGFALLVHVDEDVLLLFYYYIYLRISQRRSLN